MFFTNLWFYFNCTTPTAPDYGGAYVFYKGVEPTALFYNQLLHLYCFASQNQTAQIRSFCPAFGIDFGLAVGFFYGKDFYYFSVWVCDAEFGVVVAYVAPSP